MRNSTGISFQRSKIGFVHVTDGTSNTILLGEKHLMIENYENGLDFGDDQNFLSGDDYDLHRWTADAPRPDSRSVHDYTSFGSAHPSGLNMSYVDGSVQFMNYDVSREVFQLLGNRRDGQVVQR